MKRLTIALARWVCRELGARQALIVVFDGDGFQASSYGETRTECAAVARTLDAIGDGLESGRLPNPRG